nr:helix-turn-helix transcriptional regulator [Pseudomonas luteola]
MFDLADVYDLRPNSENFHKEFVRIRTDRGLTQKQLAEALGFGITTVQRYERAGDTRPSPPTLKKIYKFLEDNPRSNVLGKTGTPQNDRPLQSFSLDDLVEEIRTRGYSVSLQTKD